MANKVKPGNPRKISESGLTTTCLCFPVHYAAMLEYILQKWREGGRKEVSASLFFRDMIDAEYMKLLWKERKQ